MLHVWQNTEWDRPLSSSFEQLFDAGRETDIAGGRRWRSDTPKVHGISRNNQLGPCALLYCGSLERVSDCVDNQDHVVDGPDEWRGDDVCL
jgi:hypothetical protein